VAKLTQTEPMNGGTTVLPTTPAGGVGTVAGMVLGTIGYMSPEQVRGGIADPRSDIFSLGVVLHEMLSGRRPFGGDTAADVMSGILKEDPPDLPVVERHIPAALARIVNRCLEKSPAGRFQSARDLAFALDSLTSPSGSVTSAAFNLHGATNEIGIADFARETVTAFTSGTTGSQAPVWSPDGRRIAFRGTRMGFRNVWIKAVDGASDEQQLTTGDRLQTPLSWSPDGKHLLYFDVDPVTGNDIWIVTLADGKAQPLVKMPHHQNEAGWSPDGRWIAYMSDEDGRGEIFVVAFPLTGQRWRVSTTGGREPGRRMAGSCSTATPARSGPSTSAPRRSSVLARRGRCLPTRS
jgi:serine/threonine protein kinase